MSQADRQRWDDKWADTQMESFEPRPLLVRHRVLQSGGRALDLACGPGHNALWLAERGYRVWGLDISGVAIRAARQSARRRGLAARATFQEMDLADWRPEADHFDLVCVFRFLDRSLFPRIGRCLRPGGLLFYETRHVGWRRSHPGASLRYLLRRGELAAAFGGWTVLHDLETAVGAQLIARKPG